MAEKQIFDSYSLKDGDHHNETLDAFISRLEKIRAAIPEAKRSNATVDIWCCGDYATTYADVIY